MRSISSIVSAPESCGRNRVYNLFYCSGIVILFENSCFQFLDAVSVLVELGLNDAIEPADDRRKPFVYFPLDFVHSSFQSIRTCVGFV